MPTIKTSMACKVSMRHLRLLWCCIRLQNYGVSHITTLFVKSDLEFSRQNPYLLLNINDKTRTSSVCIFLLSDETKTFINDESFLYFKRILNFGCLYCRIIL